MRPVDRASGRKTARLLGVELLAGLVDIGEDLFPGLEGRQLLDGNRLRNQLDVEIAFGDQAVEVAVDLALVGIHLVQALVVGVGVAQVDADGERPRAAAGAVPGVVGQCAGAGRQGQHGGQQGVGQFVHLGGVR